MSRGLVYVAQDAATILDQNARRLTRLRDEGFVVRIATPHSAALEELAALGFETRALPGADRWNVPGRLAAYPILQGDFLTDTPLLVHGFGRPWAWVAAYAAYRANVPAIFVTKEHHQVADRARRAAYRKLGHWVSKYIVHHEEHLQSLLANELVPAPKLELLVGGRGVDLTAYDPEAEELEPVARPAGRTVVATRDRPQAREMMRAIDRRQPGIGWLFHDDPRPVAPTLAAADVYLNLDDSDITGLASMAAAAMRLPTVAVSSTAARSVIVDYETGRIGEDAATLQEVLVEVLGNPKRARDMGVRARARAEHRFDRSRIDEQLLNVYDRVLSERVR